MERSLSDMKLTKNSVRNCLTELSLSNLMKIGIASSEKFTDSGLEEIVDVWNRNGRWIAVYSQCQVLSTSIMNNNTISGKGEGGGGWGNSSRAVAGPLPS